jgi:hypothetical protein
MNQYKAALIKCFEDGSLEVDIDLGFDIIYRAKMYKLVSTNSDEALLDEKGLKKLESKLLSSKIVIETNKKTRGENCWVAAIILDSGRIENWLITAGYIPNKPK